MKKLSICERMNSDGMGNCEMCYVLCVMCVQQNKYPTEICKKEEARRRRPESKVFFRGFPSVLYVTVE